MNVLKVLSVLVILVTVPGIDSRALGQRELIRVQTTLVNVPVIVSDRQGGAVQGLKAEDFVLYDDGVKRPLAFFANTAEPIRIALLLDTSKSATTVLERIRKAAASFVAQLRPRDQAMVASFDSTVHVLTRFSSDPLDLKAAIRRAEVGDSVDTRMLDGAAAVVQKHLQAGQGRKAIILLTDGQDNASSASPEVVVRGMVDAGVVCYPIYYSVDPRELAKELFGISLPRASGRSGAWGESEKAAAALLNRIAEETAGSFYRSEVTDLKKAFSRVTEELRHQYLLGFYPDPSRIDGAQHAIRVEVSRPEFMVRARSQYRADAIAR